MTAPSMWVVDKDKDERWNPGDLGKRKDHVEHVAAAEGAHMKGAF